MCTKYLRGTIKHSQNERRDLSVGNKNTDISWADLKLLEPGYNFTDDEIKNFKIWPNGIIPYFIDEYSFDNTLSNSIRSVLEDLYETTGLRFVEFSRPPDESTRWVLFTNRRAQLTCEDYTTNSFTNKGVQKVVIGYDCISKPSNVAPTLLALAGVPPQHNAPNRDSFIQVNINNVLPEKVHFYRILKDDEWLFPNIEYDFDSAGHYDFHKFTRNGFATIQAKEDGNGHQKFGGKGIGLSRSDMWKIRMLYNYITKNENPVKTPECSKLFKPGLKFKNYVPVSEVTITTRKVSSKHIKHKIDKIMGSTNEAENKLKQDYDYSNQTEDNIIETNDTTDNKNQVKLKKRQRITKSSRFDENMDEIEELKERLNSKHDRVDITKLEDYHTAEE